MVGTLRTYCFPHQCSSFRNLKLGHNNQGLKMSRLSLLSDRMGFRKGRGGGGHLIENQFGAGRRASQEAGGDEVHQVQTGSGGPRIEETGAQAHHLGFQCITS